MLDLTATHAKAQQIPSPELADLVYINSERAAAAATPEIMDFVAKWLTAHNYGMGLACFDLLREKKCPPGGQKKSLTRQDGETPSIVHELSQALYTISLIEAGYNLPDAEMLLCLNFTHDLGEEFDVTKKGFIENLYDHGIPPSKRARVLGDLFENMTKSRAGVYKHEDNQSYFDLMLEHPLTVIAKFQDRIHNMATLIGVKKLEKHRAYITETMELRDTLKKAQSLYPEFSPVFDIMNKIVSTQIYYNAYFLNKTHATDPLEFNYGAIPRLSRISQLPLGIDPLQIVQTRAENKLQWAAHYRGPLPTQI